MGRYDQDPEAERKELERVQYEDAEFRAARQVQTLPLPSQEDIPLQDPDPYDFKREKEERLLHGYERLEEARK